MIQSWFDLMVDGDVFVAPWCIMLMIWCLHAYPPKIMRQQICFSMSRNQSNCAVVLFPGHQWRQWWPSLGNLWWILLKNDATKAGHVHKCAASYSVLFLWKIYDIHKSTTSWWFQSIWKVLYHLPRWGRRPPGKTASSAVQMSLDGPKRPVTWQYWSFTGTCRSENHREK